MPSYQDILSGNPLGTKPWKGVYALNNIHNSTQISDIKFCMKAGSGFGNILSIYWTARASCFFSYSSFTILLKTTRKCNVGRGLRFFQPYITSNQIKRNNDPFRSFAYYLPHETSLNMYNYYNLTDDEYKLLYIWTNNSLYSFGGGYPYRTAIQLLQYNPLFLPIVINESHQAIYDEMFNYLNINNKDRELVFNHYFSSNNDIVIHFRCGDVIGISNPDYGFLTLKFYNIVIQKVFDINNFWKLNNLNFSVWFLTQTGGKALRHWTSTGESRYAQKCVSFVNKYTPYIRNIFVNYRNIFNFEFNFNVIGDGDMNEDFYRMTFAPNLIISMSSFAEQAGFINVNNVFWPNWGPWHNMADVYINSSKVWVPEKHIYIDVIYKQKLYLSSPEYNPKSGKKWSLEKVINYLVTH